MNISKKETGIVKGVAVILMFIHHFFTFPEWYIDDYTFPHQWWFASHFQSPCRICVGIFAFISGYFFINNRPFKYYFKKLGKFMLKYWAFAIPIIGIAIIIGDKEISNGIIISELLGTTDTIMCFNWYIDFYICSILLLFIISKLSFNNSILFILLGIYCSFIMPDYLTRYSFFTYSFLMNIRDFFPLLVVGNIFRRYDIFSFITRLIQKLNDCKWFAIAVMLIFSFFGRYYYQYLCIFNLVINMDIVYVPIFIFCILQFVKLLSNLKFFDTLFNILEILGKNSFYMWNFSAIFFGSATARIFQPLIYFTNNPFITLPWSLLVCLLVSIVFENIFNFLSKIVFKTRQC